MVLKCPYQDQRSRTIWPELHADLQHLSARTFEILPHRLIVGYRSKEEQLHAFLTGKSKLKRGAHNFTKEEGGARAEDFLPDGFHTNADWSHIDLFRAQAHAFLTAAHILGIKARWGGDWNMNGSEADEKSLRDFDHIELTPWETYRALQWPAR